MAASVVFDLLQADCPGNHQFYRARIIPPQLPDQLSGAVHAGSLTEEQASFLSHAHAATSGRPALLILDLHPRLRCSTFQSMLHLSPDSLQVRPAWGVTVCRRASACGLQVLPEDLLRMSKFQA